MLFRCKGVGTGVLPATGWGGVTTRPVPGCAGNHSHLRGVEAGSYAVNKTSMPSASVFSLLTAGSSLRRQDVERTGKCVR